MPEKQILINIMKTALTTLVTGLSLLLTIAQSHGALGDVDLSFDSGSSINGPIIAIALQSDGRVLIGGCFTTVHGAMRSSIARLNADGSVDETFLHGLAGVTIHPSDLGQWVDNIAVQNDGKILIDGSFDSVNGAPRHNLVRLSPDGSLDHSFQVSGVTPSGPIRVQPDGKILVAGAWGAVGGANLGRLNPDGAIDVSFVAQVVNSWQHVDALALQTDGKIVVAGPTASAGNIAIARLNVDGSYDGSFSCQITSDWPWLDSICIQQDGKILIAGLFQGVNGVPRPMLARLNPDGSVDSSFLGGLAGPNAQVRATAIQSDGKLLLAGDFRTVNGIAQTNIARLLPDGSLDTSFRPATGPGDGASGPIVLQHDAKLLVVGYFTPPNGARRERLARLNLDGSVDTSFRDERSGPNGAVHTITPAADGKVLIGGAFTCVDGMPYCGLARLNGDGSLDSSFLGTSFEDAHGGLWAYVHAIAVQDDSKIVIGGEFTSLNGVARTNIARLNGDGSLDGSFVAAAALLSEDDPNSRVLSVTLQSDGKILIGGTFWFVNGVERTSIARLNLDGSLDSSFNANLGPGRPVEADVLSIILQGDGKILITGAFTSVNGVAQSGLARLSPDGSLDKTFVPVAPTGYFGGGRAVLQPDGRIITSQTLWGTGASYVTARLNPDGSLDNSFLNTVDGTDSAVMSLALQSDGKVLLGGFFSRLNGVTRNRVARLNRDGSLDTSFLSGLNGPDDGVYALALQPNGNILVGGPFTVFNQTPRGYVARLVNEVAPTIQRSLLTQTAEAGSVVGLRVKVNGSLPLFYLWYLNDTDLLSCSTNCELELTNLQFPESGAYTVVISNVLGAVTSAPALLNVIAPVKRRPVPGVKVMGEAGSLLNVNYADSLSPAPIWTPLCSVSLTSTSQFYFDLTLPFPAQRFYRAWQTGTPSVLPSLDLHLVPAITLTGSIGGSVQVDAINQVGPIDAWFTLDTVTLTNTTQLYFDTSAPGQPQRLYRLVQVP